MWLKCLKHLVSYYSDLNAFQDVNVEGGSNGQKPKAFPAIRALRNVEGNIDYHRQASGTVSLWIELWIRNDSTPMEGYENLNALEQLFLDAFQDWTQQMCKDLGIAAKISIPHFVGDGERVRPLCGSQATINIEWKVSRI